MMSQTESDQPRFDTRTGQLIHRCLRICRYHEDLVEQNYALTSSRIVPLVAFAHRPHDARSSCIAFLPESRTPHADIAELRELGVPFAFFAGRNSWEMWSLRSDGPRHERPVPVNEVEQFFDDRKSEFSPGSVFRAKTWARAEGARQLDFVDAGLLPVVEQEAGTRLRQLFEDMVTHTMDALDMKPSGLAEADAHWMMKANFWLLAGKILRDKQVPKFTRLDLNDVQDVFDRVAEHYGAKRVRATGRLTAVRGAAGVAAAFSSFRSISTETLGALYEEALLSERTRKVLSVHRTPTYLVDYMLAKLSHWIEQDIGVQNCRIFEPACGHAPFLVGSLRLMSDLLPDNIASDRVARRQFLRKHLGGCDRDAFALEIARLSLTLADIPNPNGWRLDAVKDMFAGDYLDQNIAASSLVLVNPPFESAPVTPQERANGDLRFHRNGQAGELLRRVLRSSRQGTVFGIVIPQTILEGRWFAALRRELLQECEIAEITVFPDKVFQFADVESGIILARKRPINSKPRTDYLFRRVRETGMGKFIANYQADQDVRASVQERLDAGDARLLIPKLAELWSCDTRAPAMKTVAEVGNGFLFKATHDPTFPEGEVAVTSSRTAGFHQGFLNMSGSLYTHLLPKIEWLNQKREIIARPRSGTQRGSPQVITNYAPASRKVWRHKAFLDTVGRPTASRFLIFRPLAPHWSVKTLWALWNSPVANAYTFVFTGKRDIATAAVRRMPVPDLKLNSPAKLEEAVDAYLAAARAFSENRKIKTIQQGIAKTNSGTDNRQAQLVLSGIGSEQSRTRSDILDRLRVLHWRIDAEVLKLYRFPAELERELLDFFHSHPTGNRKKVLA